MNGVSDILNGWKGLITIAATAAGEKLQTQSESQNAAAKIDTLI
jgi:hypothetical protein